MIINLSFSSDSLKKNEIKFTYDDFHREGGNKVCHDNFISTVTKKLN